MSEKIKNLKSYFNKGDIPTEAQFHELIDSFILKSSDKLITTVKEETNGDIVFTFSDTTTFTIPKYKLPTSMPVSFISGLQTALDAKATKNGDNTQLFKVKDATSANDAVSKQQFDTSLATKAAKNGDATQNFKVKDAAANDDAVSKQQLDTKAAKNGDASQIFKVKDAVAANDAISKQQFDAALNKLLPKPYIDSLSPLKITPSSSGTVTIKGSYFTPNSTVTITGQTISDFKFKSDNEISVKVTTGATQGDFDVTVNNGTANTLSKGFMVSLGEVIIPKSTDFTVHSGQADISQDGIVKVKLDNINGIVRFFNVPLNQDFQLRFKAFKSEISTNHTGEGHNNRVSLIENGVETVKIPFFLEAKNVTCYPPGTTWEAGMPYGTEVMFERKGTTLKWYANGKYKETIPFVSNTGSIVFQIAIRRIDIGDIKYIKL